MRKGGDDDAFYKNVYQALKDANDKMEGAVKSAKEAKDIKDWKKRVDAIRKARQDIKDAKDAQQKAGRQINEFNDKIDGIIDSDATDDDPKGSALYRAVK